MNAVKQYLSEGQTRPIQTLEFMAFWKSCSEEEREEFGRQAAKNLGVELTAQP